MTIASEPSMVDKIHSIMNGSKDVVVGLIAIVTLLAVEIDAIKKEKAAGKN